MVLRRKRCVSVATEGRERLHTGDVWWQCIPYSWTSNWKHMVAKCALRCHSKPCSVSGKVALMSQYNDLPLCNGTSVRPSGLIQSDRNNFTASLVTGVGGGAQARGTTDKVIQGMIYSWPENGSFANKYLKLTNYQLKNHSYYSLILHYYLLLLLLLLFILFLPVINIPSRWKIETVVKVEWTLFRVVINYKAVNQQMQLKCLRRFLHRQLGPLYGSSSPFSPLSRGGLNPIMPIYDPDKPDQFNSQRL